MIKWISCTSTTTERLSQASKTAFPRRTTRPPTPKGLLKKFVEVGKTAACKNESQKTKKKLVSLSPSPRPPSPPTWQSLSRTAAAVSGRSAAALISRKSYRCQVQGRTCRRLDPMEELPPPDLTKVCPDLVDPAKVSLDPVEEPPPPGSSGSHEGTEIYRWRIEKRRDPPSGACHGCRWRPTAESARTEEKLLFCVALACRRCRGGHACQGGRALPFHTRESTATRMPRPMNVVTG